MQQNPRVGIGVFVFRNGTFLMGCRKGAHGEGTWSVPGGHLEYGEAFEDTARREVLEETGLEVANVRFGAVTNDLFESDGKHYVTVWMLADWVAGEPRITEPDKFLAHQWRHFDDLPRPLFLPWNQLLQSSFVDQIRREAERSLLRTAATVDR